MPRRSQKKKQTRLAFAATPASLDGAGGDGEAEDDDRFARLSYGHPSRSTILPKKTNEDQKSLKTASKKSSKTTRRNKSLEQSLEPPMEEESKA